MDSAAGLDHYYRQPPRLAAVARREVVGKRLVRLFPPGIYAAPDHRADPVIAMRAVQSYSPAAVLTGRAAAHLTLWPPGSVPTVSAGSRLAHPLASRRRPVPLDPAPDRSGVDPRWRWLALHRTRTDRGRPDS